jgi:hypothetical protein
VRLAILLGLFLISPAFGQIGSSSRVAYVLDGLQDGKQVGDYFVVSEDTKIVKRPVGEITVPEDANGVAVTAEQFEIVSGAIKRTSIPVTKVEDGTYFVFATGQIGYSVTLATFTPPADIKLQVETGDLFIGEAPEPDEPDQPDDIAPDEFDNLAQRVNKLATGLPDRKTAASYYRNAAAQLRDASALVTINTVSAELVLKLQSMESYKQYMDLRLAINEDLQARWAVAPMSRGVLADWMACVGYGLDPEGGK